MSYAKAPTTKMIFLLKAKPGMSRDAFIERYETKHAPLALEIIPYMCEYRRTYLPQEGMLSVSHVGDAAQRPEFDVVTELWFENQAALDAMFADMAGSNKGELIAEDERDQFDRSKLILMTADEYVTPAELLMPAPSPDAVPAVKMVCFMRRRPGMTREEFIDYYETGHAVLAQKILTDEQGRCVFGQYRRSFPVPGTVTQFGEEGAAPYAYDFDVMTEIWFWTAEDYERFHACTLMPDVAKALSEDEAKLFDMQYTTMFIGDEHISSPAQCAAALKSFRERTAALA
jgi:hypothetical protein